jgi:glucokinase
MALAESRLGAGRDISHALYLTVGTGIGGAIMLNSSLWHGTHYSAGEIGYLVAQIKDSQPQTVEDLASGPGMERHYMSRTGNRLSLREIAKEVANGNSIAEETIQYGAHLLGTVLAPLAFCLNPEAVIVGGGVPDMGAMWWQPFSQAFYDFPRHTLQNITLQQATLGSDAVMTGAALLAADAVFDNDHREK